MYQEIFRALFPFQSSTVHCWSLPGFRVHQIFSKPINNNLCLLCYLARIDEVSTVQFYQNWTVFDLKKQHLWRRISLLIEGNGEGISHFSMERRWEKKEYLTWSRRRMKNIPLGCRRIMQMNVTWTDKAQAEL